MKEKRNPFIVQAARDYDMSYAFVMAIYEATDEKPGMFYARLEEEIKIRLSK